VVLHDFDWNYEIVGNGLRVRSGANSWDMPLPNLPGAHQYHNAALALVAARHLAQLPITVAQAAKGITSATWPARLQKLTQGALVDAWGARGEVYLDGGHNPSAAETLRAWMDMQRAPITLVLGMMKRKDAAAFLRPLAEKITQLIAVPIADNECYTPTELVACARNLGIANAHEADSLNEAAHYFTPAATGTLVMTGSLFLAGEVLKNHS
jgi:dihydrofolate synthase/folylpolyglutamate synthase